MAASYFTRNASGLVREISLASTFMYNAYSVNPILTLAFMVLSVPSSHASASMVAATAIVALLVLPISFVYASLSVAMPRSGGDYIYITRILNPALGFAANWNVSVWFSFYLGAPCVLFGKYGIAQLLRTLAVHYSSSSLLVAANWAASNTGGFVLGSIILWVLILLYVASLRVYLTFQSLAFAIGTVGVLAMIVTLFVTPNVEFISRLGSYVAVLGGRRDIVSTVQRFSTTHGLFAAFSFRETLSILVWPYLGLSSCFVSAYFGGEIRNAQRTQWLSIAGAIVFSAIVMILLILGLDRMVGSPLLAGLSGIPSDQIGLAFTPLFGELIAAVTHNIFVLLLIGIGFTLWTYVWAPVNILILTRNILAWSLDRLVPERLSDVSSRWKSPVRAIVLVGVVSQLCVLLYAFVPSFTLLTGIFGLTITFATTGLAAAVFPYRQRSLFESTQSETFVRRPWLFSLIGGISVICLVGVIVSMFVDPVSGISLSPAADAGSGRGVPFFMLLLNLGVFASGFIVYYFAALIQRRRGIDITLAYKEIPPE